MPNPGQSFEAFAPIPPQVVQVGYAIFQTPDATEPNEFTVPTTYSLFVGDSAPSASLGVAGDWYEWFGSNNIIRIYQKTDANTWELKSTIPGISGVSSVGLSMPSGFTVTNSPLVGPGVIDVVANITGIVKAGAGGFSVATPSVDYEVPLTFSTGLTRTVNTITVNASQAISALSNLTTNGFVKTTGGAGTLSVATSVNLASDVTGNLAVANLNSGTAAGITTFWRGDGTWSVPTVKTYPFRATKSAAQSLTANGNLAITYGTEVFDPDNVFASSTFTAPATGYYELDASLLSDLTSGTPTVNFLLLEFILNGSPGLDQQWIIGAGSRPSLSLRVGGVYFLTAGDTVSVRTTIDISGAGTYTYNSGISSSFCGHRVE